MWTVSLILIFMKHVVQMGFMMTFREGIEAPRRCPNLQIYTLFCQHHSSPKHGPLGLGLLPRFLPLPCTIVFISGEQTQRRAGICSTTRGFSSKVSVQVSGGQQIT